MAKHGYIYWTIRFYLFAKIWKMMENDLGPKSYM